jgi:hypothetical protein
MSKPISNISNKQFHKSNYSEALEYIIPYIYLEEDYAKKQKEVDILDQVINSHLNIIGNISDVLYVSAIPNSAFSDIDEPSGISKFFIKQNNLTDIDLSDFERKILVPLDKAYSDFETSADFSEFVNYTLLPGIRLNKPSLDFLEGGQVSANHLYLISNLSWLYFLNLSSASLNYNPSSYVHDLLISKIYAGQSIQVNDGIKGLAEYVWRNYNSTPTWSALGILPDDFKPIAAAEQDAYTSGTQQLEKLLTLIDVIYSPLYIDNGDTRVKEAIDDYIQNSFLLEKEILTGPFIKLVKAFSFAFADYSNNIDKLEIANDIDRCPDELLPYLADLIGWRLFGSEPDRWRLQLANAVDIYRNVGTKKSIQIIADSIFGQDVFDVSSSIYELWESYIPFLIQYALATESTLLEDFSTWTPEISTNLGIPKNDRTNMDVNVRYCVDKIIYDLALKYRSSFLFKGKPFPLGDVDFIFNYRDRDYWVPPFEEIPYYKNVRVTNDMVDTIVDKLVCFGVRQAFAIQVGQYIRDKVLNVADDTLTSNNGWLFFTSSVEYVPNWNSIIKDITNTKTEYLPLWNGKSSHFKIVFEASGFDFNKTSLEADSRETLSIAAKISREFSPAHAVPNVIALVNEQDWYSNSGSTVNFVNLNKVEQGSLLIPGTNAMARYGLSSLYTPSYKRGITATSVNTFSRFDADSLTDSLLNHGGATALLPRRAHRRRNLKNILPKDGFYDRTGFNMPASFQDYTVSNESFLPLGFIPSSLKFVPITDYNNIPAVYGICEDLDSSNSYNGVPVSNTYPIRGWRSNTFNISKAMDRGQLHSYVATIHHIGEQAKLYDASSFYYYNTSSYVANNSWKNVLQSYANSSTELSGNFPNSFNDYIDFELGRDFHKFYHDYTHNFACHRTSPMVTIQDGPVILAHALGSLLYNSDFSKRGFLTTQIPSLVTTNLASSFDFTVGEGVFSSSGGPSGTYIASSILNIGEEVYEYRNSGILEHIEFCQTSGSSRNNSFAVIDIDPSFKSSSRINKILDNKILIRQFSYNGFGRIILDISKYALDSSMYDKTTNFLSPDHDFNLKFKTLISDSRGLSLGGGVIGVWIHTKPELNKVWSFTSDRKWVQHSASSLTFPEALNYCNLINLPYQTRDLTEPFECVSFLDPNNPNRKNDVVASLKEEDFSEISINFNTRNHACIGVDVTDANPEYFEKVAHQVHRLNQNYVVEIFTIPTQDDKFTLYYDLSMIDLTLNKWSKPLVGGIPNGSNMGEIYCNEFRVDLSKQQILNVLKYFNQLRGKYVKPGYSGVNNLTGYASRVASDTQGFYETSGGSRINYVESPLWNTYSVTGTGLLTNIVINN